MYRVKFPDRYIARCSPAICFPLQKLVRERDALVSLLYFRHRCSQLAHSCQRSRLQTARHGVQCFVGSSQSRQLGKRRPKQDQIADGVFHAAIDARSDVAVLLANPLVPFIGVAILLPGNSESAYFASIPRHPRMPGIALAVHSYSSGLGRLLLAAKAQSLACTAMRHTAFYS